MKPGPRRLMSLAALVAAIALTLSGCGGSSGGNTGTGADEQLTATPAAQASAPPSDAKVIDVTVDG